MASCCPCPGRSSRIEKGRTENDFMINESSQTPGTGGRMNETKRRTTGLLVHIGYGYLSWNEKLCFPTRFTCPGQIQDGTMAHLYSEEQLFLFD